MKAIPASDAFAISIVAQARPRDRAWVLAMLSNSLGPIARRYIKTLIPKIKKTK